MVYVPSTTIRPTPPKRQSVALTTGLAFTVALSTLLAILLLNRSNAVTDARGDLSVVRASVDQYRKEINDLRQELIANDERLARTTQTLERCQNAATLSRRAHGAWVMLRRGIATGNDSRGRGGLATLFRVERRWDRSLDRCMKNPISNL